MCEQVSLNDQSLFLSVILKKSKDRLLTKLWIKQLLNHIHLTLVMFHFRCEYIIFDESILASLHLD